MHLIRHTLVVNYASIMYIPHNRLHVDRIRHLPTLCMHLIMGLPVNTLFSGRTLLQMAVTENNVGMAAVLIRNFASYIHILQTAVRKNNKSITSLLIQAGADASIMSTIDIALEFASLDITKMLLAAGAIRPYHAYDIVNRSQVDMDNKLLFIMNCKPNYSRYLKK